MVKFIFTGALLLLLVGFMNYPTRKKNVKTDFSKESKIIFPINEQIKLARMDKQMTSKELADRIGVTKMTIDRFEKGQLVPTTETLRRLEIDLDARFEFNGY